MTVTGYELRAFVDACLTNALDKIAPGQAQYTLCCDDETGGTVDDLIAYLRSDDDLLLIPNAASCAEVGRRLSEVAPAGVEVRDVHREYAVLAVQGTRSDETLHARAAHRSRLPWPSTSRRGRNNRDGVPDRLHG